MLGTVIASEAKADAARHAVLVDEERARDALGLHRSSCPGRSSAFAAVADELDDRPEVRHRGLAEPEACRRGSPTRSRSSASGVTVPLADSEAPAANARSRWSVDSGPVATVRACPGSFAKSTVVASEAARLRVDRQARPRHRQARDPRDRQAGDGRRERRPGPRVGLIGWLNKSKSELVDLDVQPGGLGGAAVEAEEAGGVLGPDGQELAVDGGPRQERHGGQRRPRRWRTRP